MYRYSCLNCEKGDKYFDLELDFDLDNNNFCV